VGFEQSEDFGTTLLDKINTESFYFNIKVMEEGQSGLIQAGLCQLIPAKSGVVTNGRRASSAEQHPSINDRWPVNSFAQQKVVKDEPEAVTWISCFARYILHT
jgi:hypothetical protein